MGYIKLETAAEMLGLSVDKLNEYREKYDIKGYRDGASWKFKEEEVERFAKKLGTDVGAVVESLSGVDLPTPTGDAPVVDLDADLDEMVDLQASDDEDTDGPDSVLVTEQALGESAGTSSTIIGKLDLDGDDDGDLELSLDDNESSEELVLDLDDEPLVLGDVNDAEEIAIADVVEADVVEAEVVEADVVLSDDSELKLDDSGELSLEDSGELVLDAGDDLTISAAESSKVVLADDDELKLDGGSELTLEGSGLDLADEGSELELGTEEPTGDSPTTGSGLDLAPSDSSTTGIAAAAAGGVAAAGAAAMAAAGSALGLGDDDDELKIDMGSDVISEDSKKSVQESDEMVLDIDDALEIESDESIDLDGDDLVLEGGSALDLGGSSLNLDGSGTGVGLSGIDSDVTINAGDSGIGLSSPSDSGLSLEDTPMELTAGSDIDALELGEADDDDIIDLGDDAVEDLDANTMMSDDDFLLTPVEGGDVDDADSGSQVIALDTDELDSEAATELGDEDFGSLDGGGFDDDDDEEVEEVTALGGAPGVAAVAPEGGYSLLTVVLLGMCVAVLALGGMMITDLVRNMWSWNEPYALNSALMDMIVGK